MSRPGLGSAGPLRRRALVPELMDDPALAPDRHRRALRGLARLNRVSFAGRSIWRTLRRELSPLPPELRVLDLASGAGDVAIGLWRLAADDGVTLAVEGWDVSDTAVRVAREACRRQHADVRFRTADVLGAPLPGDYDVIMCSLFLHHLDEEASLRLLARMGAAARRLVLVDDLVRSAAGMALAWGATRLLSRSRVVHVDGPRSVRAAFTPDEARQLAARAGLQRPRVRRHWPQRYTLFAEPCR